MNNKQTKNLIIAVVYEMMQLHKSQFIKFLPNRQKIKLNGAIANLKKTLFFTSWPVTEPFL